MRMINEQDVFDIIDDLRDQMTVVGYWSVIERVKALPSVQPEVKPIGYQNCANAMLRMWMDKVVTDGEYNRIMDKLNAFWGTRNERSD